MAAPLELVLMWHMHQPDYRDHASREFRRPNEREACTASAGEVSADTRDLYQRLVASDLNVVSRKDQ